MNRRPHLPGLSFLHIGTPSTENRTHQATMAILGITAQNAGKFFVSLLIGRAGGPLLLGAVTSVIATAQLVNLLGPTTLGAAATKHLARAGATNDVEVAQQLAGYAIRIAISIATTFTLIAAAVWLLHFHDVRGAIAAAALAPSLSLYSVGRGLFFGHRHIVSAGYWDILTASLSLAGVVLLLVIGERSALLVLPLAAGYGIYAFASWPRGNQQGLPRELRVEVRTFVAIGIVGTLTSSGFSQACMVAAGYWGGYDGVGLFAAALNIALPVALFVAAGGSVLFPAMSERAASNPESVSDQRAGATRMINLVAGWAVGVLIIVSDPIMNLIWGTDFGSASPPLRILLVGVMLNVAAVPSVLSLTSRDNRGAAATTLIGLAGAALGVASWLILAPRWGVAGVACGFTVAAGFTAAASILWASRRSPSTAGNLLARAALAPALGLGVHSLLVPSGDIPRLLGASFAFLGAWTLVNRCAFRDLASRLSAIPTLRRSGSADAG